LESDPAEKGGFENIFVKKLERRRRRRRRRKPLTTHITSYTK
jgi:hypothetical protein